MSPQDVYEKEDKVGVVWNSDFLEIVGESLTTRKDPKVVRNVRRRSAYRRLVWSGLDKCHCSKIRVVTTNSRSNATALDSKSQLWAQ